MSKLTAAVRRFVKDEQGISATEYGLLIAFVAIALTVVMTMAGDRIIKFFDAKLDNLDSRAVTAPTVPS